ncbi:MAG: radical SAM protein [Bacteroidales bacterium]|jgi:pyruvate formate lyase activating enzyme|nr:radical SAM protein [Bacteroidales bacterium]
MTAIEAKFIGVARHRLGRDGEGVTTLAAFHGCPLHCRYCLNPQCLDEDTICQRLTPEQLVAKVMPDNLYFMATGGGVTFGGGEPCQQSLFIEEFRRISNPIWKINIETSLNVPQSNIERIMPFVNNFIIDIKDMNTNIYKAYTTIDNGRVMANLQYLAQHNMQAKCRIRLPLIKDYNTPTNVAASKKQLSAMGFTDFDEFEYRVN